MKSLVQFIVVLLLTSYPAIVSAFAPGRIGNSGIHFARRMLHMSGKPARSKEDDIELTRAIIMKHVDSSDDTVDDDDQSQSAATKISSGVSADVKVEGNGPPLEQMKSLGSKMKSKVQSKARKLKSKLERE